MLGLFCVQPTYAMSRDVKSLLKYSGIGLGAGTLVGLVTLPLTQNVNGIWIGSSVGLSLGLIVAIYQIYNRNDPQNPLSPNAETAELKYYSPPPSQAQFSWVVVQF